jgi:transglutaminase-like putative cysteine protease
MSAIPHPLAPELRAVTGRDLAGLVLSLVIVVAPHAARAPWWVSALVLALYTWRALLARLGSPLPSRWALLAIAAAAMAGIWVQYHTLFGRVPGIVLLVLFSGLKLLEMRTHRDATVIALLCFFLIITNFFFTQSIPTALAMFAALLAIVATMVGFNAPQRPVRANLRTGAALLAQAVPAALVLFLLFPRVQGPLWGVPQDAYAGVTGLSDSMSPGALAHVALSDSVAFRAEFQGEPPSQTLLYWRGPVLWDFDGRTWRMGASVIAPFKPPAGGTARFSYEIVLEPHDHDWLFALETAASLPDGTRFTSDGQIFARRPVRSRIRYRLTSVTDAAPDPRADPSELRRALRLPRGFDPLTTALAEQWRRESGSDSQILARAIAWLRASRIAYTLEPPALGRDSIDEFLFETKAGFCEHFSSAFVFLMRAAGVPARIVTGYQGGDLNPVDHVITVRQSDAHAWAEVYLQGQGWLRVDPTAVAVPGRIESELVRGSPSGEAVPLLMRPEMKWLRALRYDWEALAHKWNVWVLSYDPQRQRDLMTFVGIPDADWRNLTVALFTILGALMLGLVAWSLRGLSAPDPVQRAWQGFCRKLRATGLERAPGEGPRDFSERAARTLPRARATIQRIGELYLALRYGADAPPGKVHELRRLVRELRLT